MNKLNCEKCGVFHGIELCHQPADKEEKEWSSPEIELKTKGVLSKSDKEEKPKDVQGWEDWKDNFCKHISDWSYYSAGEELEKIKSQARQEVLKEVISKLQEISSSDKG